MMSRKKELGGKFPVVPERDGKGKYPQAFVDDYNAAAGSAQLGYIVLLKSEFSVESELVALSLSGDAQDASPSFTGQIADFSFDAEEGVAQGVFQWDASVKLDRKTVLKLKTSYVVVYSEMKTKNAAAVFHFVRRVGRYASFPYFRQHASHCFASANLSLPVLPVLKD